MEWVNFRHLYSFWMVAKLGGFKKASEAIFVSQSTVSEQVSSLEDYLGDPLFERTTRSLHLTHAGKKLFSYADEIFQKSREINRVIRDGEGDSEPTQLNIGIVGGVSRNLIYRHFSSFLEQNKRVHFDVVNGSFLEHVRRCQNFELDLIITSEVPRGKDLSDLNARVIETSKQAIVGRKKVINKIIKERALTQKIPAYCYTYPTGDSLQEKLNNKFSHTFEFVLDTDDVSLLRFFANSNEGVAVMPEIGVYEDLMRGDLEKISIRFVEDVKFYAVYNRRGIHKDEIEGIIKNF